MKLELELLITEREGMIAENQLMKETGRASAYGEFEFQNLADKIRALSVEIKCKHNWAPLISWPPIEQCVKCPAIRRAGCGIT